MAVLKALENCISKDKFIEKMKQFEWNVQAIIPVPMYKDKEIKRGYNQAEVFGRALSKETGIALDDKCIIRKKSTVPQKKLSNEMRKINLQKAFGVDRKRCSEYKTESKQLMELIARLEDHFDIDIPYDDRNEDNFYSVDTIIELPT